MSSINLDSSKFSYFLHKMADPSFNISIQNKAIILTKNSSLQTGSLEEKMKGVLNYIASHENYLNHTHKKLIEKIIRKLSIEAKKENVKVQKVIMPYLVQLDKKKDSLPSPSISLQMAAPPQNRQEFEANLRLVLEHFPRYQLNNDLSVIDSTYKSMPKEWNFDLMYDALQAEFKKYERTDPDPASELAAIKKDILHLLKVPVPVSMGIIIETSLKNTENAAMLLSFSNLISKGIPCVVNRHFFQAQAKNLQLYPKQSQITDVDIYVQKGGDLCVVIPKGKSLLDFGFNADHLEISNDKHLTPSGHSPQLDQDIKTLFINETEKKRFFRLIDFEGHGSYPGHPDKLDTTQTGTIAGLSTPDFQKCLSSLKDKNMVFMFLGTCFGGGTNLESIHLPDETIPCPIYVESSFDVMTTAIDNTAILETLQKMMFPTGNQNSAFIPWPRPLTEADKRHLSLGMNLSNPAYKFSNLGTLLLPSNKKDIPKAAYALANPEEILDVSRAYNKERASLNFQETLQPLEDKDPDRKAYFFSDPIVPFGLHNSGTLPMILLSRGGIAQHIIKEIIAPQQNIEEIAKETFNAFHPLDHKKVDEAASKVFFIGNMKCRYEGREAHLSCVMIYSTPEERGVLFQLEGEKDFRRLNFNQVDSLEYPWKIDNSETVHFNEAIEEIYDTAATNAPSSKALLQSTAGKESQEDFIESLDRFFFPGQMPEAAKLYSALVKESYRNPEQAVGLKKALGEFRKNNSKTPRKEILNILYYAMDIASSLKLLNLRTLIYQSSYTPLMEAAKEGNTEKAQAILKDNPQMLDEVDAKGSTALMIAIASKKFETAKWLIEQGANVIHSNRFDKTPLILACTYAEPEFVKWILEKRGISKAMKELILSI